MQEEALRLLGATKRRIVEGLVGRPRGASELAEDLGIGVSAVRKHLDHLEGLSIVKSSFRQEGLGRPKKLYSLTSSGLELFLRRYDLLLSMLIEEVAKAKGEGFLRRVTSSLAKRLAKRMPKKSLGMKQESIKALLGALNELGFMASLEQEGANPVIVSRNCVFHKVAQRSPDLICRGLHNELISASLGGAKVELRECMALGDALCRQVVLKPERKGKSKP